MLNNQDYSFDKLTGMLLVYGEAQRNNSAAASLYAEMYPQQRLLNQRTFISLDYHCKETGCLHPNMANTAVEWSSHASNRQLASHYIVSQSMIWRVLNEQLLYPCYAQPVQALQPADPQN
jgi:hypothetical protein